LLDRHDKPQVIRAVPDKNKVPAAAGKNGFQAPLAHGTPAATNGVQKPNAVKEQSAAYQVTSAKAASRPAAVDAQLPGTNSQQSHGGAASDSTGTLRNQRPANGKQFTTHAALDDHVEIPEAVLFDDDPFAGEIFIPDADDPAPARRRWRTGSNHDNRSRNPPPLRGASHGRIDCRCREAGIAASVPPRPAVNLSIAQPVQPESRPKNGTAMPRLCRDRPPREGREIG
jgi:hypothetical protein